MTTDHTVTATFTINSLIFTSTVDPAEITATGPYTITYRTVITNNTGITITNPAFTYTLDTALTVSTVGMIGADLPGGGTVVLPGGGVVQPGDTYPPCTFDSDGSPANSPCTVFLPDSGTVILPDGTVVPPGSLVFPPGCPVSSAAPCTVFLPGGAVIWRANSMGPGSVVTMTLVVTGTALWPYEVTTTFNAFDGAALRDPLYLRTNISVTSPLRVAASGPTAAKQGEVITYTIAFSNVSDLPVYNVWVTDTLPAGVLPLPGVQTTLFVPMAPPAEVFKYRLPVKVTTQGGTLVNRVSISAMGLQLDPIEGSSARWDTVVAGVYRIYLPIGRR